jgi:hypothetical protein
LKRFLEFKTIEKYLNPRAQYWAETGPTLQPTRCGGLLRVVGQKADWATAWQPSPAGKTACAARCNARAPARSPRADRTRDGAVARSPAARCCQRSRGDRRGGAGQGGEGRGTPERCADGEAAQTSLGGGVQRPWGSSGGRRRAWRGPEGGWTAVTRGWSPA